MNDSFQLELFIAKSRSEAGIKAGVEWAPEQPPPPHTVQQVHLTAAEETGEYF